MRKSTALLCALLVAAAALAQEDDVVRLQDPLPKELQFIGYSFTRLTSTNITPINDVLQGQVIGRLFGPNSTTTVPRTALYAEQRFVPFLVYRPAILDGYAVFRTLFKIDFTWGDVAYGIGGNRGGAINAGQVNLQTLLANVDLHPPRENWNLVIGLQRLFDNVRDPNIVPVPVTMTSGYKLGFWGTQAVGVSLYAGLSPTVKSRLGIFQLWENTISGDDDVILYMADIESRVTPLLEVGADLWYLHDYGQEAGGISVLGQGLTSALAEYNGAVRIRFPGTTQKYKGHLGWAGAHASYNRDFLAGRWWFDAFAMANMGILDTVGVHESRAANVLGFAGNVGISYKYGMTANDRISFEGLFTTGDKNGVEDGKLSSVITGNVWGSPVGIYSTHRALVLFPDPQVVNRYYSAVHDISNMGYGTTAFTLGVWKDVIPNRLATKVGMATAFSNVAPPGGGNIVGTEVNVEARYNLKVLLQWTVNAGYVWLGDFYNSSVVTLGSPKPQNPWVFFTTLTWYMF